VFDKKSERWLAFDDSTSCKIKHIQSSIILQYYESFEHKKKLWAYPKHMRSLKKYQYVMTSQCRVELGCTETCTVPVYSTIFIALRICLEHVYRLSVRLMPLYIPYNCTVVFLFKRCCIIHAVGVLPTSHLHVDTTVVNG